MSQQSAPNANSIGILIVAVALAAQCRGGYPGRRVYAGPLGVHEAGNSWPVLRAVDGVYIPGQDTERK
jgi:hypothetical protein